MFKYRLTFSKTGYAKYVSHLDLMRMFQRAFKRAELPISYSQGFNPHQKMSIGFPLPLGVTGTHEYMDIELDENLSFEELTDRLNAALPPDFKIISAMTPQMKASLLKWASYSVEIFLTEGILNLKEKADAVFAMPEIVVEKKTKKGVSETDIKPAIKSVKIHTPDNKTLVLNLVLSCADGTNLKAQTVADALAKYVENFNIEHITINRDGLFLENMTEIC